MTKKEQSVYDQLDDIQKLYFDFDSEVKKLENFCKTFEKDIMEAAYALLLDSTSYDDDYGLSGKALTDQVAAIRALHYGVCRSTNTDAEKDGDTTYLFILINSIFFAISKCCFVIQQGGKFTKEEFDDFDISKENNLSLTSEAKMKLIALDLLSRKTWVNGLSYTVVRGKLPIPDTADLGEIGWSIDAPKASLIEWEKVIDQPYCEPSNAQ
jgi:hypothetical protein